MSVTSSCAPGASKTSGVETPGVPAPRLSWMTTSSGWPKIWFANRAQLDHPDRLVPGLRLVIPPDGPLTDQERAVLDQKNIPDI